MTERRTTYSLYGKWPEGRYKYMYGTTCTQRQRGSAGWSVTSLAGQTDIEQAAIGLRETKKMCSRKRYELQNHKQATDDLAGGGLEITLRTIAYLCAVLFLCRSAPAGCRCDGYGCGFCCCFRLLLSAAAARLRHVESPAQTAELAHCSLFSMVMVPSKSAP